MLIYVPGVDRNYEKSKNILCILPLCMYFFGFSIIESSTPPIPIPTAPSKYIIDGIHSNQDVSGSDIGSNKNYYIDGDVTAVGTVSLGDIHAPSTQSGAPHPHTYDVFCGASEYR